MSQGNDKNHTVNCIMEFEWDADKSKASRQENNKARQIPSSPPLNYEAIAN